MDVFRPAFVPDPDMGRDAMLSLQHRIRDAAVFSGSPATDTVIGVDQGLDGDIMVSHAVVWRDGGVVDHVVAREPVRTPYMPGLLSFREGSSIISCLEKVEVEPDCVLFDGSGRIHYREAGLATHIGVVFDVPSLGVAENLLCGEIGAEPPFAEERVVPVTADSSVETVADGEVMGFACQTRQYSGGSRHINPVYVSSGHRVGGEEAVGVVRGLCGSWKLPDPLHVADRRAS